MKTIAIALSLVVSLAGTAMAADEVTSKGTLLRGAVTGINSTGIAFAPEYGKGSLAIKWADIEDIQTETSFRVLHGDDLLTDGALLGVSNGMLTVGTSAIDTTTIYTGLLLGPDGPSFRDQFRSDWRYWHGSFDLGLNVQQSTTETVGFLVAFGTVRAKGPTKFTFATSYRYATEKQRGESKSLTQDQVLGLIREEYSFTPHFYAFGSGDATYDGIQKLSIRGVPKLGVGYVLWQEKLDVDRTNFLQAEVGGSWVYERYFGGDTSDYFAIAFGALAGYYLPYNSHFDWRFDYLPAVDDFTNKFLVRTSAGLTVPLLDPVSAKFGLLDEYNNQPAQDAKKNSLFLTLGLSIGW